MTNTEQLVARLTEGPNARWSKEAAAKSVEAMRQLLGDGFIDLALAALRKDD